jgi:predicted ATPase
MARVEITLFGEMEVYLDGQLVRFPTQKTKELFAYLVVHHRHAHPRAQLAGLLWPESDEEKAKANLRKTLSRLRQILAGTEYLRLSGGAMQFKADDCRIDVIEFERLVAAGTKAKDPESLERAIALYGGPFLRGIYEDWVIIESERLQTLYLEALEQLADMYQTRRAYEKAIWAWQKALQTVPWHERAHRDLMTLYALMGNRAAALQQYNEYVETVRRELNAAPLPEMHTLYENLQKGLTVPKRTESRLPLEMPFVGRERELQILQTMWKKVCQGQGQAVLIGGEIGVGKTRFVEHFFQSIREEGCIVRGAAYAQGLPYEPVLQAVRQGLRKITTERLAELSASLRSELARFVPEISSKPLGSATELPPAQGKSRWFSALTGFFELLAQERPVALFLDDLHWADSSTLEYLRHLIAQLKGLRILVLGTYRLEEAQDQSPLRCWLDELGPGHSYQLITLQRLSAEETAQALALWLGAPVTSSWLYRQTEGNPLFMRELVHSLLHSQMLSQDEEGCWRVMASEPGSAYLPESVRELIRASLRRLSERERQLVGMMAVLGRSFEFDLCCEIVRQPRERLLSKLDRLCRVGLLVEREGCYQFHHELIRQVLYDELSTERKRLCHRQIAQALEELYPQHLDELAGELSLHCERAQLWEKAITYAMRAGARAQKFYAYGEARNLFKRALGFFKHLEARSPLSDRLKRLKLDLLNRYTGRGVFPTVADVKPALTELEAAVTEMVNVAIELQDDIQLCEAYQRLARISIAQDRWEAVREARRKALDLGYQWIKKQSGGAGVASMLETTGEINKQLYRYGAALADYQHAAEIWATLGHTYQQGLVLGAIASIQLSVGKLAEARQSAERALECLQDGDRHRQASILNNLGLILREMGQWEDAQAHCERALALMRESKDPRGTGIVLINLGALQTDQGDYAEALRYLEQALELSKQEGTKGLEVELFSEIGRAHLGRGELLLALEYSAQAVRLIEEHQGFVTDEYLFYFRHFQVLQAHGQTNQASIYLQKAYEELQSVTAKIHEQDFRKSFLENIRINHEIVETWKALKSP